MRRAGDVELAQRSVGEAGVDAVHHGGQRRATLVAAIV